jgi:hypothetical protein
MISQIPEKSLCCNNKDWDNLPTEGIPNGQCIINMDTREIKMFDKEDKAWKEQ